MKRLLRNRKGDDMLVDFFAIIVFAFIIVIFLVLFSADRHRMGKTVEAEFENKDANYMLESFLRAPAVGVDYKKTVADIITEESITGDFTNTEKLFKLYFAKSNIGIGFELAIEGEKKIRIEISQTQGVSFIDKIEIIWLTKLGLPKYKYNAQTYIPGQEKSIKVSIEKII